jgi:DNA gyrase subunit B
MAIQKVDRKGKANEAKIEKKDQRWHARNRISLVFGSNEEEDLPTYIYKGSSVEFATVKFHQAKSKAIEEILDNCIDEHYRGHVTEVHTRLSEDKQTITVEDNGIGFALDQLDTVFTEFRTGSKFRDEDVDSKGFLTRTLGQNGLGAAATCLTSDLFEVTVRQYNSKKEQTVTYLDGALKIKRSKIQKFTGHSGVKVKFILAKEVYKNNIVDEDLLRKRIIDLAYNNPGLIFFFNQEKYLFKKGLLELAERIDSKSAQLFNEGSFTFETTSEKTGKKVKGKIDINLSLTVDPASEERERFISFVNSTPTFDGGFHQDKMKRTFVNAIKDKLERQAKKDKIHIVDNDVLTGITFVFGITMPNPRFESQTKRKLVRDLHLEEALESFMQKGMDKWIKKNQPFMELCLERAISRHKFQELKEASIQGKKAKKQRVEKLLDANERKDRSKCSIFICEGDSAIGGLRSSRNKLYQGGIALKGKPMNVSQATIKEILDNQEFSDIMASIGLTIGEPVNWEKLSFSKIIYLADSDVDGGHINTLLTNFFFHFWPELFEKNAIQVAKAPLFEVHTDQGIKYIESDDQLNDLKENKKIKIKEIYRNKGLGEMSPEAWKYVMSREEYTVIKIDDVKEAKQTLEICFGKDTNLRKDLLIDQESNAAAKSPSRKK